MFAMIFLTVLTMFEAACVVVSAAIECKPAVLISLIGMTVGCALVVCKALGVI